MKRKVHLIKVQRELRYAEKELWQLDGKWSLSRMDEEMIAESITGVPVTAPQYTREASTGRGCDRKVRTNFRW